MNQFQGSVLKAGMYTMHTEPLIKSKLKSTTSHIIATLMTPTYTFIALIMNYRFRLLPHNLELCIADVCKWMTRNDLKLDEEKTDFIIIAAHTHQDTTPSLCIGESVINPSESIKILGVTLDNRLTMQKHITNTCQSSYMHIRKINSIRRYLRVGVLMMAKHRWQNRAKRKYRTRCTQA